MLSLVEKKRMVKVGFWALSGGSKLTGIPGNSGTSVVHETLNLFMKLAPFLLYLKMAGGAGD
jgi:hypothetical protein